jgi:hypothetical protein
LLAARRSAAVAENLAQFFGDVVVNRTRVSFLLRYAQFGELLEQLMSFDLEFPRQHVNANLVHK